MKKIFYILIVNCLLLIANCYAQPSITWNRLYDGGYYWDDVGHDLCKTADGNFVLGGETIRLGYLAAMCVKIDQNGNVLWLKHYLNHGLQAMTATSDGGVVFVAGGHIAKINSIGDTTWGYYYMNSNIDNLFDVIQCSDGGYVTCGSANLYNSLFIMKIDSVGNFLWQQTIPDPGLHPRFEAVCEAYSNDYIVTGRKYSISYDESVIARFGVNGQIIWIRPYAAGDSLGSGKRIMKRPPYYNIACWSGYMKIDDSGNVVTAKRVPKDFNYAIYDMQFITDEKFVIVTESQSLPGTCLTKIYLEDTLGHILHSQPVLLSNYVRLNRILLPGNGDILLSGDASRYDTSNVDFYAIRCDSNLSFPPIGVRTITEQVPALFLLYQNYPNPFNPKTTIKYDLPKDGYVTFKVYDILGKELYAINEFKQAGTYTITLDGSNYASGLYFYRLVSGSYVETKKMVLVK